MVTNFSVNAMHKYRDLGYMTFDMADIYGPAEVIFGKFYKGVSILFVFLLWFFNKL